MLENSKKERIIISSLALIVGFILEYIYGKSTAINLLIVAAWAIAGIDIIYQAYLNLKGKMLLAEHFLMSIATIGALAIGEYKEAAMVMVLFQIGEYFEDRAIDKSRDSIGSLLDIQAPVAYRINEGVTEEIDLDDIEIGDILEVRSGDKIPVDGIVVKGSGSLDTSALTGESIPISVKENDRVLSGSINGSNRLLIRAEKTSDESTAMKIIELIEEATEKQAETESLITRFSKIYTPIVVAFAFVLAFIIPFILEGGFSQDWFKRGLIFLVVSCPCAFVISIPLSFVMGIGAASKLGILVKGGNVFEKAVEINTLATDKTGTLTEGKFKVIDIHFGKDIDESEMLLIAKEIERASNHPIAEAIRNHALDKGVSQPREMGQIEDVSGKGLKSTSDKEEYILGKYDFMKEYGFADEALDDCVDKAATMVHLAQIKPVRRYYGHYIIKDSVKDSARGLVKDLEETGIKSVVMLTGDGKELAKEVGAELNIDKVYANLLPDEKLQWLKDYRNREGLKVAYIGDGLNDAPVMVESDLGISMGGIGSDATIEASDVVIVNDNIRSVEKLFSLSRYTMRVARENIYFSLGIKLIFLILSSMGLTQMWMAVFADVGVTLLAIANAFRIFLFPKKHA